MPRTTWLWAQRTMWGIAGITWFIWLGFEDRSLRSVILLAVIISLALVMRGWNRWIVRPHGREEPKFIQRVATAGLLSALVGPIAALLILIKVSLHQHPTPDFTDMDLIAVLKVTPVWGLVGILVGGASGLLALGKEPIEEQV